MANESEAARRQLEVLREIYQKTRGWPGAGDPQSGVYWVRSKVMEVANLIKEERYQRQIPRRETQGGYADFQVDADVPLGHTTPRAKFESNEYPFVFRWYGGHGVNIYDMRTGKEIDIINVGDFAKDSATLEQVKRGIQNYISRNR